MADTGEKSPLGHFRDRTFSVLLAEPNPYLRAKFAEVLGRYGSISSIFHASGTADLTRKTAGICPDFVLADISILHPPETIRALRRSAPRTRIIALSSSKTEPYLKLSDRLGLDGVIEKGHVIEEFLDQIDRLCSEA